MSIVPSKKSKMATFCMFLLQDFLFGKKSYFLLHILTASHCVHGVAQVTFCEYFTSPYLPQYLLGGRAIPWRCFLSGHIDQSCHEVFKRNTSSPDPCRHLWSYLCKSSLFSFLASCLYSGCTDRARGGAYQIMIIQHNLERRKRQEKTVLFWILWRSATRLGLSAAQLLKNRCFVSVSW